MVKTMKHVLIFSHTDLDGIGGIIVSKRYAEMKNLPYEFYRCNYTDINETVGKIVQLYMPKELDSILISDISVNEEIAELLESYHSAGVNVVLRDHHATATWLNQYDWAFVSETDGKGILRCGTYWMAKEFPEIFKELKTFVLAVDSWDTWKWKEKNNIAAKNLNSFLSVVGYREFIDYIDSLDMENINNPKDMFNDYAKAIIEAHDKIVGKMAWNCERSMWVCDMTIHNYTMHAGIIFCSHDLSDVANIILDKHPELDFLTLFSMPRSVSFRSQKKLPVDLGYVAKAMTGNGGGHPYAAGATINKYQFRDIFGDVMDALNGGKVKIHNLHTI